MAITGASLADGQLPAAAATLFTAAVVTYEKTVTLFNTSGVNTETVAIYFTRLASANVRRQIRQIVLAPLAAYEFTIALPMVTGDTIDGASTHATTVDYVIGGGITS